MNLILKEKRKKENNTDVRVFAFKVLNHSMSTDKPDHLLAQYCDKFIEILGLRVLMPIFQKPSSILAHKQKKKQSAVEEVEEHSLSIILALLRFCKQENLKRILNKFVELNMVKTERLVELYLLYSERLRQVDQALEQEGYDLEDEETRDSLYPRRMESGLFTLQLICHIIIILSNQEEATGQLGNSQVTTAKEGILKLLNMHRNVSVDHVDFIKSTIVEYSKEKSENEEAELIEMANKF